MAERRNGGQNGQMAGMAEWQNGEMADGMVEWWEWWEWREWQNGGTAEWQNGRNGYIRTIYGTCRQNGGNGGNGKNGGNGGMAERMAE